MNKIRLIVGFSALLLSILACNAALPLDDFFSTPSAESAIEITETLPTLESTISSLSISADLIYQQDALISLYEKVSPGVVSIYVATPHGTGQGSGFVIDQQGHIVTNFHVVEGANYLEVSFTSGLKIIAEIIGEDTDSDLAVLKVDLPTEELFPLELGSSEALRVGQTVIAIGNPFGLSGSMSTGIVSSLGRSLDSLNQSDSGQFFSAGDIIQTDAAINPGNSGGPLLNINGEVVGINRAIRTFNFNEEGTSLNSGIGFAVSVDMLKRVAPSLIATGSYDYPYLGLSSINSLTLADAEQLGLDRTNGVFITDIASGGPSDEAGLLIGDMILEIHGRSVADFNEMISYLFVNTSPGERVTILVLRDNVEFTLELVLGARP
jgi:2-alkenal reductase